MTSETEVVCDPLTQTIRMRKLVHLPIGTHGTEPMEKTFNARGFGPDMGRHAVTRRRLVLVVAQRKKADS